MVIIGLLVSIIVILFCRLWVFTQVFAGRDTTLFWRGLLGGGIAGILLLGTATLTRRYGIDLYDTDIQTPFMLAGLLAIRGLVTGGIRHKRILLVGSLVLVALGGMASHRERLATTTVALLLAALTEETMKFFAGKRIYDASHELVSDLLLWCMLSALGFALVENCVYLYHGIMQIGEETAQLQRGTQIIFVRGLLGSRVHMLFSALIARGVLKQMTSLHTRTALAGIGAGIALHASYNAGLLIGSGTTIFIMLAGGYFLFSRLLYQTDRLYLDVSSPLSVR